MEKQATRQQMLRRRQRLESSACDDLSLLVQQQLLDADFFSRAETLALYSSVNNEVKTDRLLAAAVLQEKQVCFPRVDGEHLQFVRVDSSADFQPGCFGVAEPVGDRLLDRHMIDLIVVPGVAFDRNGYRLGYGKGFYDRELATFARSTIRVGFCYDFQLCDALPIEGHDQPLDYIATETQLIPCHKEVVG